MGSAEVKTIHLIVVGDESVDEQLAGIPIVGAHSAILFDVKTVDELSNNF